MTDKLIEALRGMVDSIVLAAPKVVTGVVLMVLALVLAKIVEKVLRAILVRVRLDTLLGRVGVDKALQRVGLRQELSRVLPRLVYFLLIFLVAKIAADTLGLVAVSDALTAFFAFLPNLLTAIALIVIGTTAGPVVGEAVARAAEGAGIDFAPALGRMVSALILFVVGLMALAQLQIDTDIIRLVTAFSLAGFAIAFGLSFGLGTREITRNIIAGFYARKILEVGRPLEIRGQSGVLRAVTTTHTLIESDDRTVSIANSVFLDEVARQ